MQTEGFYNIEDLRVDGAYLFITVVEKEGRYQGKVKLKDNRLKIERVYKE